MGTPTWVWPVVGAVAGGLFIISLMIVAFMLWRHWDEKKVQEAILAQKNNNAPIPEALMTTGEHAPGQLGSYDQYGQPVPPGVHGVPYMQDGRFQVPPGRDPHYQAYLAQMQHPQPQPMMMQQPNMMHPHHHPSALPGPAHPVPPPAAPAPAHQVAAARQPGGPGGPGGGGAAAAAAPGGVIPPEKLFVSAQQGERNHAEAAQPGHAAPAASRPSPVTVPTDAQIRASTATPEAAAAAAAAADNGGTANPDTTTAPHFGGPAVAKVSEDETHQPSQQIVGTPVPGAPVAGAASASARGMAGDTTIEPSFGGPAVGMVTNDETIFPTVAISGPLGAPPRPPAASSARRPPAADKTTDTTIAPTFGGPSVQQVTADETIVAGPPASKTAAQRAGSATAAAAGAALASGAAAASAPPPPDAGVAVKPVGPPAPMKPVATGDTTSLDTTIAPTFGGPSVKAVGIDETFTPAPLKRGAGGGAVGGAPAPNGQERGGAPKGGTTASMTVEPSFGGPSVKAVTAEETFEAGAAPAASARAPAPPGANAPVAATPAPLASMPSVPRDAAAAPAPGAASGYVPQAVSNSGAVAPQAPSSAYSPATSGYVPGSAAFTASTQPPHFRGPGGGRTAQTGATADSRTITMTVTAPGDATVTQPLSVSAPDTPAGRLEGALRATAASNTPLFGAFVLAGDGALAPTGEFYKQPVRDAEGGGDYWVKFYLEHGNFETENRHFTDPDVRAVMDTTRELYDNADAARVAAPTGYVLPPHAVVDRGMTLESWLLAGAPPLGRGELAAARGLVRIAEQLRTLHESGWVHNSVQAASVIRVERLSTWMLTDFGSAVKIGSTIPDTITVATAAPEVILAFKAAQPPLRATPELDVWALGLVAFELLTKTRVFPPEATFEEMLDALSGATSLPWEEPSRQGPLFRSMGAFRRTVLQCLERSPRKRPTAGSLVEAWAQLMEAAGKSSATMVMPGPLLQSGARRR